MDVIGRQLAVVEPELLEVVGLQGGFACACYIFYLHILESVLEKLTNRAAFSINHLLIHPTETHALNSVHQLTFFIFSL